MTLEQFQASRTAKRFIVRVKRCNRWDVYPQQEPVEACEVVAYSDKWIADALAEQHPRWRVASPVFVSVTEVEGPVDPRARIAA